MKKVVVFVDKLDKNYAACIENIDGFVCTANSFEELQKEVTDGLLYYLEGMRDDGDVIPDIFKGEYEFSYKWDVEINSNEASEGKRLREGWEQAAKEAHENGDDKLLMDFPNDFDKEEWTW